MTKTKINLHNNYKVKVIGSNGEIKDEGYAENTVLNGFWDRVDSNYSGANQFTHIRIGTGSPEGNEVDPSRTTLYNQIGGKIQGTNPIIESNLSDNVRVSSKVMTCTIPATSEYEGEITEIGCGGGNYLNSLALFKDSEGNPISIYKSSEDVMIVEVTVYVVINYAEDIIPIDGIDSISDIILNRSSGGIFYNSTYVGEHYIALTTNREAFKVDSYNPVINDMSRLGSITIPRPKDRVLKNSRELIFDEVRTNDTYGNLGFANYITIQGLGSVKLPNENYFSKYFISDIEVGEGDGVKTEFSFPIPEFIVDTDVIKVDGVPLERDIDYTLAHDNNSLAYSSSFASMKEEYKFDGDIDPFTYDETSSGEAYIVYEEDIYVECYKVKASYSNPITVSYSVDGENYVEAFSFQDEPSGTIVELEEPIEAKYWKISGRFKRDDNDAFAFGKKPTHLVFTNPPAPGAKITATMQVDRPFKSDDFIFDTSFKMSY